MKFALAALVNSAVLLAAMSSPAVLLAQTAPPTSTTTPISPAPKAAAKPSAKASASKSPAAVRRSALKAVEEVTPVDDDPNVTLTAQDLETAQRVFVGSIPCEFGASVVVTPSTRRPGFFVVQVQGMPGARFRMHPVESRTGAIRLEDPRAGAMWLQLGNKSMLMSQKLGKRLADECMSPSQATVADDIKKNPRPGLLDGPAVVK